MNIKNKINLAVMAHVDAGKTTVTEEFLYHSGAKKTVGNVDKGTTTTDSLSLEKERGITIQSATVSFDWKRYKINLIDTPGHMDFVAEVERTFSVLDGVVLVISAKEGVQPQTRALFSKLRKMKIPTIFFINKIDRMGVNLDEIRGQIEDELTKDCIYMQEVYENDTYELQIREHTLLDEFIDSQIILYSDLLYDKYVEQEVMIEQEEYKNELYNIVQDCMAYPVYYGSALRDIGMEQLLDGIVSWLYQRVNPLTLPPFDGSVDDIEMKTVLGDMLSAYVYKIEWLGKNYRKAYVRVYSGGLWFKQRVPVYGTDSTLVVNMFSELDNGKEVKTDMILPGDICAMYGANILKCGQWLGQPTKRMGLGQELDPLLSVQVRPHEPEKREEVIDALYELDMEEPYLHLTNQEEQITLRLFGRLQKDIIQDTIMGRYQLKIDFDDIKTIIKECPKTRVTEAIHRWESFEDKLKAIYHMQFNQYAADIELMIEPLPAGSGIEYVTKVSYGELEKSYQNAVKEGVLKGLEEGLNHEIVDTRVTFTHMEYDSVTSTPADFRSLATIVVKKCLIHSGVKLIQPYMNYTTRVPLGFEKYIVAKLNDINALILTSDFTDREAIYCGEVALDNVKDFAIDIKMYTEGKGSFDLEFLEYR